jgi:hypothetical protein
MPTLCKWPTKWNMIQSKCSLKICYLQHVVWQAADWHLNKKWANWSWEVSQERLKPRVYIWCRTSFPVLHFLTNKIFSTGWAYVWVHKGEGSFLCWNCFFTDCIVTSIQVLVKSEYNYLWSRMSLNWSENIFWEKIECQIVHVVEIEHKVVENHRFRNIKWESLIWRPLCVGR